jgi:hypothetical protein
VRIGSARRWLIAQRSMSTGDVKTRGELVILDLRRLVIEKLYVVADSKVPKLFVRLILC